MYRFKRMRTFIIILVITVTWFLVHINTAIRTNHSDEWKPSQLDPPAFINLSQTNSRTPYGEILVISKEILTLNREQKIYNLEKFGPVSENTYVLVIQVHSRVKYLSLLLGSLSRMQNIENSLIIFSHDLYLPELNKLIQNIDFARFMQIFYPHSNQLNPNRFPGQSPDDCPRNITLAKAKEIKCRNADHPDIHGHYREARYTQLKHHWWWKANFVFDKLDVLQNYGGVIAFLEEDHYVSPDFLWMLNLMETTMIRNLCYGCNVLSLGTTLATWNIRTSYSRAVVNNAVSSMGLSFNKTLWEKLKHCAPTFCKYDDYNWDWSLLEVSYSCLAAQLDILYAKTPRVFHIGNCGIHYKQKICYSKNAIQAIEKDIKLYNSLPFPDVLTVELRRGKKMRRRKGYGGWGDPRDIQLCMSFVTNR